MCLRGQLVFICYMLIEFDEVMSAHQYHQGCGLSKATPICRITSCQGVYGRQIFDDMLVSVPFGGYDRSPSTWALHADIHCHIFLEIKANKLDKDMIDIVAYYLGVQFITCF